MRSFLLGAVAALGLPAIASATVQINVERVEVVPDATQKVVFVEVFGQDLDNTNEQLNSFSIALSAPTFTANGVRFEAPETFVFPTPTGHPYVFQSFVGVVPEDFGTTFNRALTGAGLPGTTPANQVNITDALNGFVRIPIIVPANAAPGFYPIIVEAPPTTALAGLGAPIVSVPGQGGGVQIVPEPASLGLIVLGGLLTLRRRRVA